MIKINNKKFKSVREANELFLISGKHKKTVEKESIAFMLSGGVNELS